MDTHSRKLIAAAAERGTGKAFDSLAFFFLFSLSLAGR